MDDKALERRGAGCGLFHVVFGRRHVPRRTYSALPMAAARVNDEVSLPSNHNLRRRRGNSDTAFLYSSTLSSEKTDDQNPTAGTAQNISIKPKPIGQHGYHVQGKKVPFASIGVSGELESMIVDHQRSRGASKFIRASSGNVMLYGHLGNLRQPCGTALSNSNKKVVDHPSITPKQETGSAPSEVTQAASVSQCQALSTGMDPENLKTMGNEDYKNGRYAEALTLYEAAIAIDPNKASYRSNRSAALAGLGRVLEAVFECREALRIEPHYHKVHNRLATLYLRLGEAERAMYHHKRAGREGDPDVIVKVKKLQGHLNKCTQAKTVGKWNTLLEEASLGIAAGADSAPLIHALQAEALLRLRRHQDADETLSKAPNFDVDHCTKLLGPIGNATLLVIRAQVDMAAGRIDEAVAAAERAGRLDPNSKEVKAVVKRVRAVVAARSDGNNYFKAAKYSEACTAYGEGLDLDPSNPVLLCNRAACWSKLDRLEDAIQDCTATLTIRPSYAKARLRRADCYAKLGNWDACIQDYELLMKEAPENEEVALALKNARHRRYKQPGQDDIGMDVGGNANDVVLISSNERFRDCVTSPVMSVVLFCNKPGEKKTLLFMRQLCVRYPSVNYFKVEVEDHPSLAKSEGLSSLPAFKIYKNSSKTREIPGDNHDLLESSIKFFII